MYYYADVKSFDIDKFNKTRVFIKFYDKIHTLVPNKKSLKSKYIYKIKLDFSFIPSTNHEFLMPPGIFIGENVCFNNNQCIIEGKYLFFDYL
tara:strand:+ start:587 stop:862 length:276 start_codon:yes stop_codon:yes gene_type:complete